MLLWKSLFDATATHACDFYAGFKYFPGFRKITLKLMHSSMLEFPGFSIDCYWYLRENVSWCLGKSRTSTQAWKMGKGAPFYQSSSIFYYFTFFISGTKVYFIFLEGFRSHQKAPKWVIWLATWDVSQVLLLSKRIQTKNEIPQSGLIDRLNSSVHKTMHDFRARK